MSNLIKEDQKTLFEISAFRAEEIGALEHPEHPDDENGQVELPVGKEPSLYPQDPPKMVAADDEVALEEAQVVRQIFRWIGLERASIGEVCRRLQRDGVRTRTGKTTWDRSAVWGMLKNPAYKGKAAFGKTRVGPLRPRLREQRGRPLQPRRPVSTNDVPEEEWIFIPVPALVDEDLFDAAQAQLQENRQRARQRKRGARYLLQGLIVCAQCQYAYYGKPISNKAAKGKTRDYAYYRCIGTDAYRFGGERICDNMQVRTDTLDQTIWQQVCVLLEEPQRLEQEYRRRLH